MAGTAEDLADGLNAGRSGDYDTMLRLWRPLGEKGNPEAQYYLGTAYDYGRGVPKDPLQAIAWFRKAALQGQVNAQYNLGNIYEQGRPGVPQDYVQAFKWLNLAAAADAGAKRSLDRISAKMTPEQLAAAKKR